MIVAKKLPKKCLLLGPRRSALDRFNNITSGHVIGKKLSFQINKDSHAQQCAFPSTDVNVHENPVHIVLTLES